MQRCGGGESLDAEARLWRLMERGRKRPQEDRGCQPSPYNVLTKWDVRQARETYGYRALTQPGERTVYYWEGG